MGLFDRYINRSTKKWCWYRLIKLFFAEDPSFQKYSVFSKHVWNVSISRDGIAKKFVISGAVVYMLQSLHSISTVSTFFIPFFNWRFLDDFDMHHIARPHVKCVYSWHCNVWYIYLGFMHFVFFGHICLFSLFIIFPWHVKKTAVHGKHPTFLRRKYVRASENVNAYLKQMLNCNCKSFRNACKNIVTHHLNCR